MLAACAFGLAACGPRETVVQRGDRDQVLHRGIGADLADLDPHLATQAGDYNVLSALLEGLVSEDPVDLHPVPGVAERWDISPDGLTYTFHLRADARWSDGEPVTAQDFVASFRRMLTPSLAADYAPMLYVIQGAEAFHHGQADFSTVGVVAPDARTLRVTLDHAVPYFLSLLNHTAWFPVPLRVIEKYGSTTERGNAWARPGRFVGNGPFNLKAWHAGQEIVVVKSPTYWDAAHVRLTAIHFHAYDSIDAEERAFRAGQLHLTEALPPSKIAAYRRDDPALLRIDPLVGTYFYRLNVRRPFLNDVRIRRALSLAVDRSAIVEKILGGGQLPAHAFTPPGIAGYTSRAQVVTDFDAARQLLADAGYPGGKGIPPLELLFNSSETHRLIAEAVQATWRRELGVDVRLVNQDLNSTLDARRTGNFQILRSVWTADYLDPNSFLAIWTGSSGNNYTGWADSGYDSLLFAADRTADRTARFALLQKAEGVLLDAAPLIPIYHYTHVFVIRPSVHGWHPTLLDHHPYKYVYLATP
ncbi:peptide ABC transporter substrate-binding protein [Horticoccus luteus]|uniref:Peptide ABC transporter substrate-binding protein n=1 Tax=Horticoccus luteus TaxID=2862869 RepID=A0A8F9XN30_9BACT|nr:peptide ABC transporter substrate-binding protein [Horticoccus luteus]